MSFEEIVGDFYFRLRMFVFDFWVPVDRIVYVFGLFSYVKCYKVRYGRFSKAECLHIWSYLRQGRSPNQKGEKDIGLK